MGQFREMLRGDFADWLTPVFSREELESASRWLTPQPGALVLNLGDGYTYVYTGTEWARVERADRPYFIGRGGDFESYVERESVTLRDSEPDRIDNSSGLRLTLSVA